MSFFFLTLSRFFAGIIFATILGFFFFYLSSTPVLEPEPETPTAQEQYLTNLCQEATKLSDGDFFCRPQFDRKVFHFVMTPNMWSTEIFIEMSLRFCEVTGPGGKIIFGFFGVPLREHSCQP